MTVPGPAGEQRNTVVIQVAAEPTELPPLRTVAADLAVRADFDLDTVADLRLAVDEAAAELIAVALPGSSLTSAFTVSGERMHARLWVRVDESATVATNGFGWRVLTSLVDDAQIQHEHEDQTPVLVIALRVQRRADDDSAAGG